jgi:hypothetical protein
MEKHNDHVRTMCWAVDEHLDYVCGCGLTDIALEAEAEGEDGREACQNEINRVLHEPLFQYGWLNSNEAYHEYVSHVVQYYVSGACPDTELDASLVDEYHEYYSSLSAE